MVIVRRSCKLETIFLVFAIVLVAAAPALAQQGSVLTTLENQIVTAARGWETTIMNAARSLFWTLAGIEISIAAVWLAINAASLDTWFAELVRRIMFIGLFAFILDQGPSFAKAVVDSLFQIGAGGALPRPPIFSTLASASPRKCRNRQSSDYGKTTRWRSPRSSR